MAMSVGGGGDDEPMMDINTTPLIDVMLVLLIMFIITIPVQTHAVKLDLPQSTPQDNPPPIDPIKNRSEEHTSELQSLMRISYAVICLKKKKSKQYNDTQQH